MNNHTKAFIALLRAGLWEKKVKLSQFGMISFDEVNRIAEEQSVMGLVAAGLEHVIDVKVPQEVALSFAGTALQLEQRNTSMNEFLGKMIERMRCVGIYAILVKGQGLAQCYERPLWRACGDIDLFLSNDNYDKATKFLCPLAAKVDEEESYKQHLAMTIDDWEVELHGSLRSGLWKKIDSVLDEVQKEIFFSGSVRSWMNGNIKVFLPRADEDVVYVFTHILQHFFKEGIGLRQICDWCRLLWIFRDSINIKCLEQRINKMQLMTEWKAFASLAVDYLGMPSYAVPFYSEGRRWKCKAKRVLLFVLETGNFGHNRDYTYYKKHNSFVTKMISFSRHTTDSIKYSMIFPIDSLKIWWKKFSDGIKEIVHVKR